MQRGTVQKNTVEKWIKENDTEIATSIWLKFEISTVDRDHVAHFRKLFVRASRISFHLNITISKVRLKFACLASKEHAQSETHKRAVILY